MNKLPSVQVLRGIAALMVTTLHSFFGAGVHYSHDRPSPINELNAGVDLFFVISGVVMALVLFRNIDRPFSPTDFIRRRVNRIVPIYWICTLLWMTLLLVKPGVSPQVSTLLDPGYLIRCLLFIPPENELGELTPIVLQGWSLTYEMLFYLILALFFRNRPTALSVGITIGFAGLAAANSFVPHGLMFVDILLDPLKLEFVAGLWIGWLHVRGRIFPATVSAVSLAIGVAGLIAHGYLLADPGYDRCFHWGLPATLIAFGVLNLPIRWTSRSSATLIWLGEISYSLYLTHVMTITAFDRYTKLAAPGIPLWPLMILAPMVAVLVAGVFWATIERPLLIWMNEATKSLTPIAGRA